MNKRIRYSKVKTGVLLSRRNFVTGTGQTVVVILDLNAKRYQIVDATSNVEVTSGGNTKNVSVLKIQAKRGLVGLGVSFAEETRNRGSDESMSAAGGQ
jgi:hypothetical protein